MKILVTGAAGMLASSVVPELVQNGHRAFGSTPSVIGTDINLRLPEVRKMDVTNLTEVDEYVRKTEPDFIFHLAAETDVDLCEQDPDHAFRTNTLGTENVALACQKHDVPMLYISTAGVFYGDKPEPYTEMDEPRPANVYGVSKLFGELAVKQFLGRFFIVRAGWMVGGWDIDKKFVYKIVRKLKNGEKLIRVVSDKFGSPSFTKDFAKNLLPLIATQRYGLYHMTNKGSASRYEIALKIVDLMGLSNTVKVEPINSAEFPLPAPRARSEAMRNYRLDLLGMNQMPHWEESLERYIRENYSPRD